MTNDIVPSQFKGQQTPVAIAFSDVVGFSTRMSKDERTITVIVTKSATDSIPKI